MEHAILSNEDTGQEWSITMIIDTAALVLKSTTITTQAGIAVAVAKLLDSDLLPDITTCRKDGHLMMNVLILLKG